VTDIESRTQYTRRRTIAFYHSCISHNRDRFPYSGKKPFSADDLKIERLRCEYLENPLGIDDPNPRLSWILTSDIRGSEANAYQILVASRKELLEQNQGDLWDSGKIESNRSIHVAYAGKPLESQTFCFWKVRFGIKTDAKRPGANRRFGAWVS
jgi:hypothetical protein